MSLHTDIFFLKKNNHLLKRLYLSSINQYVQGKIDTLSLGKAVLKQLKVDGPQIQNLFTKCDNASSYQGDYFPQTLYQLCMEQDIMLVRYDNNEPCMGKCQCNCECDGLKTMMKSLNADSVNGIFVALSQRGFKKYKNFCY